MSKKGIIFFGVTSIIMGLVFLFYLYQIFIFTAVGGWCADRPPYGFLDWLTLFVIGRISLGVFYIFSAILVWSGIALLRMKAYGRKLIIITSLTVALSGLINNASLFANSIINNGNLKFTFEDLSKTASLVLYGFCIYTILLIIYLSRPKVKEQFKGRGPDRKKIKKILLVSGLILILFIVSLVLYCCRQNKVYRRKATSTSDSRKTVNTDELLEKGGAFIEDIKLMQGEEKR